MKPEDKELTADLFSSFNAYNEFLEGKKNYYSHKETTYAIEKKFSSKPDVVFFCVNTFSY